MRRCTPVLLLPLLFIPAIARADVPPRKAYAERCTVANEQRAGEACILCGDAYHGDVDACRNQYAPEGYEKRCQTSGASVWNEVWCRSAGAGGGPAPTPSPDGPPAAPEPDAPEPLTPKPAPSPEVGTPEVPAPPAPPATANGGCVISGSATGAATWSLALLALLGVRRRRRSPS